MSLSFPWQHLSSIQQNMSGHKQRNTLLELHLTTSTNYRSMFLLVFLELEFLKSDYLPACVILKLIGWSNGLTFFKNQYDEAEKMLPYIEAGKPVFAAEYTDLPGDFNAFCEKSKQLNFSTILKNRGLDAWIQTCP